MHCTKISPEFEYQRSRSPGTNEKNDKVQQFLHESSSGVRSRPPVLRPRKNQRMLSSFAMTAKLQWNEVNKPKFKTSVQSSFFSAGQCPSSPGIWGGQKIPLYIVNTSVHRPCSRRLWTWPANTAVSKTTPVLDMWTRLVCRPTDP